MADGDGAGIGGIVRLRYGFEFEYRFYHFLHLGLVGSAVSREREFDFIWFVLEYIDTKSL